MFLHPYGSFGGAFCDFVHPHRFGTCPKVTTGRSRRASTKRAGGLGRGRGGVNPFRGEVRSTNRRWIYTPVTHKVGRRIYSLHNSFCTTCFCHIIMSSAHIYNSCRLISLIVAHVYINVYIIYKFKCKHQHKTYIYIYIYIYMYTHSLQNTR